MGIGMDEKVDVFFNRLNQRLYMECVSVQRIDIEMYTFHKFLLLKWDPVYPVGTPHVAGSTIMQYIKELAEEIVGTLPTFSTDRTQFWFTR